MIQERLSHYFPEFSAQQIAQFEKLQTLFLQKNSQINLISRKDEVNFEVQHLLHSLSIAKFYQFQSGMEVLDVGTGGGLPGIPLAIAFPDVQFTLNDSIQKKIRAVDEILEALSLANVKTRAGRAEQIPDKFDMIVSRAVTNLPDFVKLVRPLLSSKPRFSLSGILYLKGGDFEAEIRQIKMPHQLHLLPSVFEEAFFETKKLVHLF